MKISGIYEIVNKVNGKRYYGSSVDIKDRFCTHRRLLRLNKHTNSHLQSAWNKYGADNFIFNIIKTVVNLNKLIIIEQKYLNICKENPESFYNISYCAEAPARGLISPMKGKHHTKETIQKIKENLPDNSGKNHPMFGKKHSKKSIQKMKRSHKNYKPTKNVIQRIKETCIKKHLNSSPILFRFFNKNRGEKICKMIDLTYEFNLDGKHVSDICRRVRKSHKEWICLGKI